MRRRTASSAVAIMILTTVALAGCSASSMSSNSGSGDSSTSAVGSAPSAVPPERGTMITADGKTSSVKDRQVITTGTMTVTVEHPTRVADSVATITQQAGGRVDGRVETAPTKTDAGSATLTLRVPSAALDGVITKLKKLGAVQGIAISRDDVTAESQDLDARITALTASVDRLIDLMSKASTTADLITIESALSERQTSLESLESQKRTMDDQVDLSTLTLTLGSPATARVVPPSTFLDGLGAGWAALVGFLSGLLVVIGAALPWLVLVAIIGAVILTVVRLRRRRGMVAKV